MVKLRLQRTGTKNEPHYRIVAADSRFPRDGRFIDVVGQYHPINKANQVVINDDTVKDLFKKSGLWSKFKAK